MFKNIDFFLEGARSYCEDEAYACQDFAFVLDGATGVTGEHLTCDATDAVWFVKKWREYLINNLGKGDSILQIVKAGVIEISEQYLQFEGGAAVVDKPSAALSIVRFKGDKLEYYSICDSVIIFRDKNGKCSYIMDDRLVELDNINFERMKKIAKEKNKTIAETFVDVFPFILENRIKMNTPDGYAALAHTVNALETARIGFFKASDIKDVLLCSDGFAETYDLFGIYKSPSEIMDSVEKIGAKQACANLRALQEEDATCAKFIRNKKGDDISLIFAKIG